MNNDLITLTGNVAKAANLVITTEGTHLVSFRFGSTPRKRSRAGEWEDLETNWYTVLAFGTLADNLAASVSIGDPLIVAGKVQYKKWDNGEKNGTDVQIVADAAGHDLTRGKVVFTRTVSSRSETESGDSTAEEPGAEEFATAGVASTPVVPF